MTTFHTPPRPTGGDSAFPGAEAPARQWRLQVAPGLALAIHEWGDAAAPPLFLAHGGADFGRTFDRFAPLLAAGGWRVVTWDHRGHGDSDRAAMYSWRADVRDALLVTRAVAKRPAPLVGHSKGGGLFSHLSAAYPEAVTHFVNIDGIPRHVASSSKASPQERLEGRDRMFAGWLDHWRHVPTKERRPGTVAELAERRARMNPRLSSDWLRYLVSVGATQEADGWRWNLDPAVRMGPGLGPWRPDWGLRGLREIEVPMLAILGRVREPMGWGNDPDQAREDIPEHAELLTWEDSGHFVHIEHPERTADAVLRFLDSARLLRPRRRPSTADSSRAAASLLAADDITVSPTAASRGATAALAARSPEKHRIPVGRLDCNLIQLRAAPEESTAAPLLILPALGESATQVAGITVPEWPAAIWTLDWPGHGSSSWAPGGGYTSEALLNAVDRALERLGPCCLLGRGLGSWVALQAQGTRPTIVRGILLCDGPGLRAGGAEPGTLRTVGTVEGELRLLGAAPESRPPCDPLALRELDIEVRPEGYARLFLRQAVGLSDLEKPVICDGGLPTGDQAPAWLAAVREAPGSRTEEHRQALDILAGSSRVP